MRITYQLLAMTIVLISVLTGQSQPPAPKEKPSVATRIIEMKEAPAGPADTPLRVLQKERFNARLHVAQSAARAVQASVAPVTELAGPVSILALNGADLEDRAEGRVKWFQLRVDVLKDAEQDSQVKLKGPAMSLTEINLIRANRADAEIDLLLLNESIKKNGK
jgi:hypothetical protein